MARYLWVAFSFSILLLTAGCAGGTSNGASSGGGGGGGSTSPLTVTTTSLPNGVVGTPYTLLLVATGGSGAGYSWVVTSGTGLSSVGLSLASNGTISGTPTASGSAVPFSVQVTDSSGDKATASFTITVSNAALTITTASLPNGMVGANYSFRLQATGGTGGYTWSGSTTAPYLSVSSSGLFSGLAFTAETADPVSVQVTDSAGDSTMKLLTVTIAPTTEVILTSSLPTATVGIPYSFQLESINGSGGSYNAEATWSIASGASSLSSAGLSLSAGGLLAGTPTESVAGLAFTAQVTGLNGVGETSATLQISINYPTLAIGTVGVPGSSAGSPYSASFNATGGSGKYSWSISAGLSTLQNIGLSFEGGSSTGILTGAPNAKGNYPFTVQVTDTATNDTLSASYVFAVASGVGPSGQVHGGQQPGQQPIAGANLQLWSAGTTGYGSQPTLLASTTTDSGGNFNLPIGSWSTNCTANGSNSQSPVYITSSGGDAGQGSNPSIVMMAALGKCSGISASTFTFVDEATTVGAAYALGAFMNPANPAQIGSHGTSQGGLLNAFATANNIVSSSTGVAFWLTPYGNGAVPQAEIDSLANILASCVNGTASGCKALEDDAYNASGNTLGSSFTTPANTLMVAQQVAAYPANNVAMLYGLVTSTPPFQPALNAAPNDWTLAVSFAANGADNSPNNALELAIDSAGNVWIANQSEDNVEKINNLGVPYPYSPLLGNVSVCPIECTNCTPNATNTCIFYPPTSIAIDAEDNAWISPNYPSYITKICAGGTICGEAYDYNIDYQYVTDLPPYEQALMEPSGLAFDGAWNLWASNVPNSSFDNQIVEYAGAGNGPGPYSASYFALGVRQLSPMQIDGSGNLWIFGDNPSLANKILVEYSPQVTQLQSVIETLPTECAGSTYPSPVALDQSGNIWGITPFRPQITGEVGASLLEFNTSGTLISGCVEAAALTLGDVTSIAVDGSNRIWLSNLTSTEVNGGIYSAGGSIVAFANSGQPITPATGYANNGSFYPSGISIDSSGNVWVGNEMPTPIPGTVNSANVVEFVGMATPVQTPLASGLAIGKIAPEP